MQARLIGHWRGEQASGSAFLCRSFPAFGSSGQLPQRLCTGRSRRVDHRQARWRGSFLPVEAGELAGDAQDFAKQRLNLRAIPETGVNRRAHGFGKVGIQS